MSKPETLAEAVQRFEGRFTRIEEINTREAPNGFEALTIVSGGIRPEGQSIEGRTYESEAVAAQEWLATAMRNVGSQQRTLYWRERPSLQRYSRQLAHDLTRRDYETSPKIWALLEDENGPEFTVYSRIAFGA